MSCLTDASAASSAADGDSFVSVSLVVVEELSKTESAALFSALEISYLIPLVSYLFTCLATSFLVCFLIVDSRVVLSSPVSPSVRSAVRTLSASSSCYILNNCNLASALCLSSSCFRLILAIFAFYAAFLAPRALLS